MIKTEIDTNGYHLVDTASGERRTFTDQREFAYASLVVCLQHGEEIDAGLARLHQSYTRNTDAANAA